MNRPDRVRGWIAAPLVAAACFLTPAPGWVVDEFYSRDFYPWLQNWLTALTNAVPFAVIDVLIGAAVLAVVVRLALVWGVTRRWGVSSGAADLGRRAIRAAGVLAILFLGLWGCNYRRVPLDAMLQGGVAAEPTTLSLQDAISDSNALAASLRPAATATAGLTYPEVAQLLQDPMRSALTTLNQAPLARAGRPKTSILLSPFFTWAGVTGMVNPFGLESIVHPDLLPFERPFVLAHEWAHLAGRADEAEASAVGWLACMGGGPRLAYSASVYLIMEAASALPPALGRQAMSRLDPGVRGDISAIGRRMQLERPEVREAAFQVYDEYLRANRVADGTASYSRALTLILSEPLRSALGQYKARAK